MPSGLRGLPATGRRRRGFWERGCRCAGPAGEPGLPECGRGAAAPGRCWRGDDRRTCESPAEGSDGIAPGYSIPGSAAFTGNAYRFPSPACGVALCAGRYAAASGSSTAYAASGRFRYACKRQRLNTAVDPDAGRQRLSCCRNNGAAPDPTGSDRVFSWGTSCVALTLSHQRGPIEGKQFELIGPAARRRSGCQQRHSPLHRHRRSRSASPRGVRATGQWRLQPGGHRQALQQSSFVNNKKIHRGRPCKAGDHIQIGQTTRRSAPAPAGATLQAGRRATSAPRKSA